MYANPAHIRKHRVNLSINDEHRALFSDEAEARGMQVTPVILQLALEALAWRRGHASDSVDAPSELRRANA